MRTTTNQTLVRLLLRHESTGRPHALGVDLSNRTPPIASEYLAHFIHTEPQLERTYNPHLPLRPKLPPEHAQLQVQLRRLIRVVRRAALRGLEVQTYSGAPAFAQRAPHHVARLSTRAALRPYRGRRLGPSRGGGGVFRGGPAQQGVAGVARRGAGGVARRRAARRAADRVARRRLRDAGVAHHPSVQGEGDLGVRPAHAGGVAGAGRQVPRDAGRTTQR